MKMVVYSESSCEGFFPFRTAKFKFSNHSRNISCTLCIANIIYSNFMYITFIIYTIYINFNQLHLYYTHNLHHVIQAGILTQELLHRSLYRDCLHRSSHTGVLIQESLHRSSSTDVLAKEFHTRLFTKELFYGSSYTEVNF